MDHTYTYRLGTEEERYLFYRFSFRLVCPAWQYQSYYGYADYVHRVADWCEEQFGPPFEGSDGRWAKYSDSFAFTSPEHALLFRLRWC